MKYIYPDGNQVVFVMFLFEAVVDFSGLLSGDYLLFQDLNGESISLRLFDLSAIKPEMLNVIQLPVFK